MRPNNCGPVTIPYILDAAHMHSRPNCSATTTMKRLLAFLGVPEACSIVGPVEETLQTSLTGSLRTTSAASFLSVDVPGDAAIGVLQTHASKISDPLAHIPSNIDVADIPLQEYSAIFGEGSPANELWHVLRGRDTGCWGMGETRTSKLMARKRPRLIPIFDSIVGPLWGSGTP